jgi:hypothetical protein
LLTGLFLLATLLAALLFLTALLRALLIFTLLRFVLRFFGFVSHLNPPLCLTFVAPSDTAAHGLSIIDPHKKAAYNR